MIDVKQYPDERVKKTKTKRFNVIVIDAYLFKKHE